MPLRKFRSRHKFGKKSKSARGDNFQKRPASPKSSDDVQESAASEGLPTDEVGLTSSATPTHCERLRHDTTMLQPSELEENKRKAEKRIQELESTGATKGKMDFVGNCEARPLDDTDGRRADDTFSIVSLECPDELLRAVKCNVCGGDVNISKGEREYGLAVKLFLVCGNCGDLSSAWSSPRAQGSQKVNPFAVNILAARAMQSTGNRQTALNDVFAAMNISHRGLHTKTWQGYVKKKLTPAATRVAEKVLQDSAHSVRQLYLEQL